MCRGLLENNRRSVLLQSLPMNYPYLAVLWCISKCSLACVFVHLSGTGRCGCSLKSMSVIHGNPDHTLLSSSRARAFYGQTEIFGIGSN